MAGTLPIQVRYSDLIHVVGSESTLTGVSLVEGAKRVGATRKVEGD